MVTADYARTLVPDTDAYDAAIEEASLAVETNRTDAQAREVLMILLGKLSDPRVRGA